MLQLSKLTAAEAAHAQLVQDTANRYGIPGAMLAAIVWQESRWNHNAKNLTGGDGERGGSYGLAQMSLLTARGLGYTGTPAGLLDPRTNLDLAAKHLRGLLRAAALNGYGFDSVVSAYNAGNSGHRPGDGKRETINRGTPAEARRYPFINQASYVAPVLSKLQHYVRAGFSAEAPAYSQAGGVPWVLWFGAALVILGAV